MMPKKGFKVLDPGHTYQLGSLDGDAHNVLTFVKRHDHEHEEKYPGNTNSYPGTTLQCVIRALMDRVYYLQNQIPCPENEEILEHLGRCLLLLERRAADRHKRPYEGGVAYASTADMCSQCGHTGCEEYGDGRVRALARRKNAMLHETAALREVLEGFEHLSNKTRIEEAEEGDT